MPKACQVVQFEPAHGGTARGGWSGRRRDALAARALVVYHLTDHRQVMGAFLDALVPDESERARVLAAPRALFRF